MIEDAPIIGVGTASLLDRNVFGPYATRSDTLESIDDLKSPHIRDGWRSIGDLLLRKGFQEIAYRITERGRNRLSP